MIIKYIVPNPYYDKEENKDLDRFAYEYVDNIISLTTYQRKNALGEIFNVVRYEVKPGYSTEILVEDEFYILNDEGKTIRVIRPHRVTDVKGPEKAVSKEPISVCKLLNTLSVEGVYSGNRLLEAVSGMATGNWNHIRIVSEKNHGGKNPELYTASEAFKDCEVREADIFQLFAGHSMYNGCSVIHAIERLASTGVIAPPLPVEEEAELRKLGKFNCIVCMDRSKCETCNK